MKPINCVLLFLSVLLFALSLCYADDWVVTIDERGAARSVRQNPGGMSVSKIWFNDLNGNDVYDQGDEIYNVVSTDSSLVFYHSYRPVIYWINPVETQPSQPGNPKIVKIKGKNFGYA